MSQPGTQVGLWRWGLMPHELPKGGRHRDSTGKHMLQSRWADPALAMLLHRVVCPGVFCEAHVEPPCIYSDREPKILLHMPEP